MRYITVPTTITVTPAADLGADARPEEIPFSRFAAICWLDDDRAISGGFSKQVRWAAVVAKMRAATPRSVIDLEDEDFATLATIVETPTNRLRPSIAIQLLPYSQAVLDAPADRP